MNKEKFVNLLSMAQRAGAVISGDFIVERTIKRQGVKLLIVAMDIAANNEKKYKKLIEDYKLPHCSPLTKEELGRAIGKEHRVVVAITDKGFAEAIKKILE